MQILPVEWDSGDGDEQSAGGVRGPPTMAGAKQLRPRAWAVGILGQNFRKVLGEGAPGTLRTSPSLHHSPPCPPPESWKATLCWVGGWVRRVLVSQGQIERGRVP